MSLPEARRPLASRSTRWAAALSSAAVRSGLSADGISILSLGDITTGVGPIGLFLGRLANFINSELWGRHADPSLPWAMIFPNGGPLPRHPSQLYEALLEGALLFAILAWMFWRTKARYEPGKLVGAFTFFYGLFRFLIEYVREPDTQLIKFAADTGLHMGQWLSLPMILLGAWLMFTAKGRRQRVEPIAGSESVA